ncbi:helix-turn-helix transcriptional regulator, partial [uncultured Megasphaera sp.]
MAISENIKLLREKYRLSQKDLALIAGVSDKAVSTWERGLKEPRMGAIQKIADHFGIKKSNLIEDGGMASIATLPSTNNSFTPEEINVIKKYRRLTPE